MDIEYMGIAMNYMVAFLTKINIGLWKNLRNEYLRNELIILCTTSINN